MEGFENHEKLQCTNHDFVHKFLPPLAPITVSISPEMAHDDMMHRAWER